MEKLKDPNVLETFQAVIGGKSALLTIMNNEDADMDSMITTFDTAVIETASENQNWRNPSLKANLAKARYYNCWTNGNNNSNKTNF